MGNSATFCVITTGLAKTSKESREQTKILLFQCSIGHFKLKSTYVLLWQET